MTGASTRRRILHVALGGGAVLAGGAAIGARGGGGTSQAAPSQATDAEILNLFLLLEQIQEGFYREALQAGLLEGGLARFARTVAEQETAHVELLTKRLDGSARARPQTDFGDALSTATRFRTTAIELEEATIATYIAQGANLTREATAAIVPMVSVEARQVAWVRDLAGESPAPRAADPPRAGDDVVAELRRKGFIA